MTASIVTGRQPHATSDLASRRLKAQKIERLLNLKPESGQLEVLEIGCGSGGISYYFATHPVLRCRVTAVDVHDSRQVHEGYDYVPVNGVELPFDDARFDVVISNHVIEHVGERRDQLQHLYEIRRVLKPGGVGYLAVPNRWMITEPHYRLKFLSWLPRAWRTPYLRWRGRGSIYDCEPLQCLELEALLRQADLHYRNLCIEGLRTTFEIEHPARLVTRLLSCVPDAVLYPLRAVIPTLIYRLEKCRE